MLKMEKSQITDDENDVDMEPSISAAPTPTISSIIGNLALQTVSLSIEDVLRYSIFSLSVLVVVLYLFPNYILMILLCMVLIVLILASISIKHIDTSNTPKPSFQKKPINLEKLEKLRAHLKQKLDTNIKH